MFLVCRRPGEDPPRVRRPPGSELPGADGFLSVFGIVAARGNNIIAARGNNVCRPPKLGWTQATRLFVTGEASPPDGVGRAKRSGAKFAFIEFRARRSRTSPTGGSQRLDLLGLGVVGVVGRVRTTDAAAGDAVATVIGVVVPVGVAVGQRGGADWNDDTD